MPATSGQSHTPHCLPKGTDGGASIRPPGKVQRLAGYASPGAPSSVSDAAPPRNRRISIPTEPDLAATLPDWFIGINRPMQDRGAAPAVAVA